MKILSGTLRGRNFYMPGHIRPTQNLTRKAVFDIIGHDLSDIEFLELFAGSGAVGLEAVSLGAKKVSMIEKNVRCANVISENLQLLKLRKEGEISEKVEFIHADAFAAIKQFFKQKRKFDVLFLDPPYNMGLAKKTLKTLVAYDILHPACIIIIEYSKREILPQTIGRFSLMKQKKYGKSYLAIYKEHRDIDIKKL